MKVSRTMAYAVQAILQLAHADSTTPISCHHLAHEGQMPERFLLQVLRNLVNHGILRSIRGVEGGYVLAKTPDQITLLDVFEAFDTPIVPSIPPLGGLTDAARLELSAVMNRVAACAQRELVQVTMLDLLTGRHSTTNLEAR